jgi:hypothetical protein
MNLGDWIDDSGIEFTEEGLAIYIEGPKYSEITLE